MNASSVCPAGVCSARAPGQALVRFTHPSGRPESGVGVRERPLGMRSVVTDSRYSFASHRSARRRLRGAATACSPRAPVDGTRRLVRAPGGRTRAPGTSRFSKSQCPRCRGCDRPRACPGHARAHRELRPRIAPPPQDQRPVNQLSELKSSPLYSWAILPQSEYLRRLGILFGVVFTLLGVPVASQTFDPMSQPLEFVLSASTGETANASGAAARAAGALLSLRRLNSTAPLPSPHAPSWSCRWPSSASIWDGPTSAIAFSPRLWSTKRQGGTTGRSSSSRPRSSPGTGEFLLRGYGCENAIATAQQLACCTCCDSATVEDL